MRILIMSSLVGLIGCRTVKSTLKGKDEMWRGTELNTVAVKAATKETNVLTYWPDGRVYQFRNVKEQVEQAKLGRLNVEEKQVAQRSAVVREREPAKAWVYVGVGVALIAALLIYLKIK